MVLRSVSYVYAFGGVVCLGELSRYTAGPWKLCRPCYRDNFRIWMDGWGKSYQALLERGIVVNIVLVPGHPAVYTGCLYAYFAGKKWSNPH